jgi:hypothetical protein
MQLRGSRVEVPTDEIGVCVLELHGTLHESAADQCLEPGGLRFHSDATTPCTNGSFQSLGLPRPFFGCWGTWVYAHADSVPAGERVGSAVVIWPTMTNGSRGVVLVARSQA